MKKKIQNKNYQKLFYSLIKEKYVNLFLGLVVSFVVSAMVYGFFQKLIPTKMATNFFYFNNINTSPQSDSKPEKIDPTTYIIQEGDDLWRIAEKFYGSGFNAYDISVANNLKDPSILTVGTKLIIPQVTPRETTSGYVSGESNNKTESKVEKYVVQRGDSLSSISQKVYGNLTGWPKILQANKLSNPDQIEIGMVLTIPR